MHDENYKLRLLAYESYKRRELELQAKAVVDAAIKRMMQS